MTELASPALRSSSRGRPRPAKEYDHPLDVFIRGNGARDQAIIVLGLATALRPKELWLLQLTDIDLRDGWLSVRLETTKTDAGERVVPLDPQVAALLDGYINDFRGTKPGPLFLNARGDPFAYWGFMSIYYRLLNRLRTKGINGFQAYRSRHTGITNWVRQGVEAPIVQQLAGHKAISTTQLYIGRMQKSDIQRRVPSRSPPPTAARSSPIPRSGKTATATTIVYMHRTVASPFSKYAKIIREIRADVAQW